MKKLLAVALISFLLLPLSQGFGQVTNTNPTLAIKLTSTAPFSYKDSEGYTVVIGEIANTKTFPVTNVKIWVGFYSSAASGSKGSAPLESSTGSTILDVIPGNGKSPFMIKSKTANPQISEITINILGFNSAAQKQQSLEVTPSPLSIGNTVKVSADITNNGQQGSIDNTVYLIAFDAFNPPRIVGIETQSIDSLAKGQTATVQFNSQMDYRASKFTIVAESDQYQSKFTDIKNVTVDTMTKLISIFDIDTLDDSGEHISEISVGDTVDIASNLLIQYSALSGTEQQYVYYAQVKEFGETAPVDFVGTYDGVFNSASPQTAMVQWTPSHPGGYFIEAYVWDPDGVALAAPSKTVSIILVSE